MNTTIATNHCDIYIENQEVCTKVKRDGFELSATRVQINNNGNWIIVEADDYGMSVRHGDTKLFAASEPLDDIREDLVANAAWELEVIKCQLRERAKAGQEGIDDEFFESLRATYLANG